MLDFFQQIFKQPTFGIVWGLIGFLIGNKFAINRDKRKEFNELIETLRHDLIGVRNNPLSSIRGSWMITVTLIREKLPLWKRGGFDRAVKNYNSSKSDDNISRDGYGHFKYKDPEKVVDAANNFLKYLKPK